MATEPFALDPAPARTVCLDGENRNVDDALGVHVLGRVEGDELEFHSGKPLLSAVCPHLDIECLGCLGSR